MTTGKHHHQLHLRRRLLSDGGGTNDYNTNDDSKLPSPSFAAITPATAVDMSSFQNPNDCHHHPSYRRSTTIEELEMISLGLDSIVLQQKHNQLVKSKTKSKSANVQRAQSMNSNDTFSSNSSSATSSCEGAIDDDDDQEEQEQVLSNCLTQLMVTLGGDDDDGVGVENDCVTQQEHLRTDLMFWGETNSISVSSFSTSDISKSCDVYGLKNSDNAIEIAMDHQHQNFHHDDHQMRKIQTFRAKRTMTPRQERWNALTMIPHPMYCILYILSGSWIDLSLIEGQEQRENFHLATEKINGRVGSLWGVDVADEYGCLNTDIFLFRYMPALPPLTAVAVAIGISLHAPFSFLYHWKYATRPDALTHWSRRMDQAMIHVAATFMSYATSGNAKYFLVICLYNLDCCYKQLFDPIVKPSRNQQRIFLSFLLYTLPVLRRGDVLLFTELWAVLILCGWLFCAYPLGGWSHSIFHLVSALIPPLLMVAALELSSAQPQMEVAAQCAISRWGSTATSTTSVVGGSRGL